MKNILILGKNSYLGENLFKWLQRYPEKYNVDIVTTLEYKWKEKDFARFDTVVNFAGIAHINHITEDMKDLFYSVNRDLAIEIGKYAKEFGVKHFIHFSSMNVYGDYCNNIIDRDSVNPTSFYGGSKWEGELGLQELEEDNFKVSRVRPPFVYGKGCPGNYNTVSKIAKKIPAFPIYKNRKSMIYIDNLCEFIRLVIDSELDGALTPQNKQIVSTFDLVREIAKVSGRKVWFTKLFNWAIPIGKKVSGQVRRAFDDDCYSSELSNYFDWDYCVVDFEESISRTESE